MSDHKRIWLQTSEVSSAEYEGRTWCEDPIDDTDTEYVRADLFATLEAERDELRQAADVSVCETCQHVFPYASLGVPCPHCIIEELRQAIDRVLNDAAGKGANIYRVGIASMENLRAARTASEEES